ncbi:hypothetical protein [Paenibacillus silagei]|uniref:Uncharacterized protein n=1 Tax=Paenibacillus silagei TaxID=1670801 RepID=A0ABS4NX89_9BACL|nr:hypothetical protein [Paenibacillus silagei]MBP2114659.1 hypothetical protein [Paenibacillus silagei]
MINKRFSKTLMLAISSLILIGGLGYTFYHSEASKSTKNVTMHFDLTESFDSADSLEKSAPVIAKVKVNTAKSFDYGNIVFTLSDAEIQKIYKGNLTNNTAINILETGGTGEDGLNYSVEGNAVFSKGDEAIVYLEKYVGPVAEDAYVIKGVYEGKFRLEGERIIPPEESRGNLEQVTSISDLNL